MNFKKLNAYSKLQTHIGIHTGNGITDDKVDITKANEHYLIKVCTNRKIRNQDYRNMSYEELKSEYRSGSWKTADARRFAFQAICKEKNIY